MGRRYGVIGDLGAWGRNVPGAPWVRAERQSPQPTRYALFPFLAMSHRISTDVCAPRCARTASQLEIGDTRPSLPPRAVSRARGPAAAGSPLPKAAGKSVVDQLSVDRSDFGRASQCLRGGSGAALHPAGHHIAHPHSLVHARRETGYRRGSRPE